MQSQSQARRFEFAQGLDRGDRPYQEDCVAADFSIGEANGFAILADGMGAHSAGDLASSVVVGHVFSFLKSKKPLIEASPKSAPTVLRQAVEASNDAVAEAANARPDTRGMGATLVACALTDERLYWISIGDSPLYMYREGNLQRINQDHSMAPQIDAMVATGQISAAAAATHPDRNVLTSAISGNEVAKIDCPEDGLELQQGDILILSSDGLQSLKDEEIQKTVRRDGHRGSANLVKALLQSVKERQVPDQDNVSIIVIRVWVEGDIRTTETNERPAVRIQTAPRQTTRDEDLIAALDDEIEEAPDFLKQALSM